MSLLSAVSGAVLAQSTDAAALYAENCAVCHGDNGDGRSHASRGLEPPPRDFTSLASGVELTRTRVLHAIENGVPGTAMTGWKTRLDSSEISALAEFIRSRFIAAGAGSGNQRGALVYAENCSVCHGDRGEGAMWATQGLSPPPANFTDPRVQRVLSREHMLDAVTNGRAETAMTSWKTRLDADDIEAVVDYIITTMMPGSALAMALESGESLRLDQSHGEHGHGQSQVDRAFANGLVGDAGRGESLYRQNCATCHGEDGGGRGPRAYFINPKPRNFLHPQSRVRFDRPTLFEAIGKGRLRSEMPAWEKVLTPQQIADISEYVYRTFIRQDAP